MRAYFPEARNLLSSRPSGSQALNDAQRVRSENLIGRVEHVLLLHDIHPHACMSWRREGKDDEPSELGPPAPRVAAVKKNLSGALWGCSFFAYNWKLPAYNKAFLLTILAFLLTADNFSLFTYIWSFFAYSGKVRLIRALRDCKQRS